MIVDKELDLFYRMLRIRLVEEAIAERYSDQEMRCPIHLSIGQEAVAVGACYELNVYDVIVSTHRSHGHYLAKGGSLDAMFGELYGRVTGCCGGRGGSMHLFDKNAGVLASVPIVGSTIPLGVGAALKFHQRNESNVSMIFLGDAATEEGVFHESLNFASLHRLPAVFVVENNFYSVYTSLKDRQPDRSISLFADAHSMHSVVVDGNDVLKVYELTKKAINLARARSQPSLIIADTYRWLEHCGPSYDNDVGYRSAEEVKKWQQYCPVEQFRSKLKKCKKLTSLIEERFRQEILEEIGMAISSAQKAPFPDPESAGARVYA